MFDLGKKIINLRKQSSMTQDELAEKIGISKQGLLNYETEKRLVPLDVLSELAIVFNIKIADFFNEDIDIFKKISSTSSFKRIPIISEVSAGMGKYGREDILEWLELPMSLSRNCDYGTFINGDSMEPKILDGDLILVQSTPVLDNGVIGVFKIGENVFCKQYFSNPITKEITLKSINSNYPAIKINHENGDDFFILGRVLCKIDYNF